MERHVIASVLNHRYAEISVYSSGGFARRTRGTPQGNSISLFVANAVAHELDLSLSRVNGAFARFADDSIIVNYSYEDALQSAEVITAFIETSGISI